MGKSGCGMFFNVILVIIGLMILTQSVLGWIVIGSGLATGLGIWIYTKRNKAIKFLEGLDQQAATLEALAKGELAPSNLGIALSKGETTICVLQNMALTEYQSTGSSYSGGSVGVSFPLFGRVRGNVGGQSGSITKNPEELMVVDQGQAIFTNQRIVFSGAKFVRDWDLKNAVNLEPGPNGINVKIAVTNRDRTSGLQSFDINAFGPGYAAAYVFNMFQDGEASAKKWANDLANEIRAVAAAERAKKAK
jgi:hypothetical protein